MKPDPAGRLLRDPAAFAVQLGAGRAAIGVALLIAPVPGARLLGTDTATARRVEWLSRMLAVRDGALGAGAFAAARRNPAEAVPWLLAGAAADLVDATVMTAAVRRGRLKGVLPRAIAALAGGAAAVGAATALRLRAH